MRKDDATGDLFAPREPPPLNDLDRRARIWMRDNPEIYALFERYALEAARTRRRYSIWAVVNRVRWDVNITWRGDFKISNDYPAYIARRLIREHPELGGLLVTKRVRGED